MHWGTDASKHATNLTTPGGGGAAGRGQQMPAHTMMMGTAQQSHSRRLELLCQALRTQPTAIDAALLSGGVAAESGVLQSPVIYTPMTGHSSMAHLDV